MNWIKIEEYDDRVPDHLEIVLVYDEVADFTTIALYVDTEQETPWGYVKDYPALAEIIDGETDFYILSIMNLEMDFCVTHWAKMPKPI